MKTNDGGPAFARKAVLTKAHGSFTNASESEFEFRGGMSLRDWFAGMAFQAIIEHYGTPLSAEEAKEAYEAADMMLKAREG